MLILSLALTLLASPSLSEEPLQCYLGVLHAHSVLSPDFQPKKSPSVLASIIAAGGSQALNLTNGPLKAWKRAALQGKLDFLAITDHLHGKESSAEPCSHEMPSGGYALIRSSAAKINSDPQFAGRFLAIPGMEWNSISQGNHINIFFAEHAVPNSIKNGEFGLLRSQYILGAGFEGSNANLLIQMNHPNQNGGSLASNYGRKEFPSGPSGDTAFVAAFRDLYCGIEHINNSDGGNENAEEKNAHRNGDSLATYYRRYLNLGLRLGPVGDHDNHRPNWGRHTAARTGVWASDLSVSGFVEAYKARRFYATEDNEMEVSFRVNGQWMGSELPLAGAEVVMAEICIQQREDTDTGQVNNEGPYVIELFADLDGPGGKEAKPITYSLGGQNKKKGLVNQGSNVSVTFTLKPGAYVYLHVRETNDQYGGNNADAWTAPVFATTGALASVLDRSAPLRRTR